MSYRQWEIAETEISEAQRAGLSYWRELAAEQGRDIPLVAGFDLMRLPASLLPTTHVVDTRDGGATFRYRFWGSGFRNYLGYDGTGMSTDDLMPVEIREPSRKAYADVVAARKPLTMLSAFVRGGELPRQGFQRFIRLPLADADGNVIQVVSIVEFLLGIHEAQDLLAAIKRDGS